MSSAIKHLRKQPPNRVINISFIHKGVEKPLALCANQIRLTSGNELKNRVKEKQRRASAGMRTSAGIFSRAVRWTPDDPGPAGCTQPDRPAGTVADQNGPRIRCSASDQSHKCRYPSRWLDWGKPARRHRN